MERGEGRVRGAVGGVGEGGEEDVMVKGRGTALHGPFSFGLAQSMAKCHTAQSDHYEPREGDYLILSSKLGETAFRFLTSG